MTLYHKTESLDIVQWNGTFFMEKVPQWVTDAFALGKRETGALWIGPHGHLLLNTGPSIHLVVPGSYLISGGSGIICSNTIPDGYSPS